ncbi:tyrosine-type recombinase/integrase [Sorangium sp. So ce1078]|uniref:tyrosine-type recombinase/integrase n=1 Tax=Sorangium sp. So ce1078 TaxID=3133329 RepID=UPI003F5E64C5
MARPRRGCGVRLTGREGKFPLHFGKSVGLPIRQAGLSKRVRCHVLRHSFAPHLLEAGDELRTIRELLGHRDVAAANIFMHALNRRGRRVTSSLDGMRQGTRDQITSCFTRQGGGGQGTLGASYTDLPQSRSAGAKSGPLRRRAVCAGLYAERRAYMVAADGRNVEPTGGGAVCQGSDEWIRWGFAWGVGGLDRMGSIDIGRMGSTVRSNGNWAALIPCVPAERIHHG